MTLEVGGLDVRFLRLIDVLGYTTTHGTNGCVESEEVEEERLRMTMTSLDGAGRGGVSKSLSFWRSWLAVRRNCVTRYEVL